MKNKSFDCVKMMRDIRNKIHEEWKDLPSEKIIEFLNKKYPEISKKKEKTLTNV